MKECSKSIMRRMHEPNFSNRYFVGKGLDIGGGPDPLGLYLELFPRMQGVKIWDKTDGNAETLDTIESCIFDFVHSSHCLEHLDDPSQALQNWFRVLKPDGYLVIMVPDEDMYEQGEFPSTWNGDHKFTFTISKKNSWSPKSINILDLLETLDENHEIIKIQKLDASYRYNIPRFDQSLTPIGECGIEIIIRKRPEKEVEDGGRMPPIGIVSKIEEFLLTGFKAS
ncbi:MAG: class I SAM-dependent methyltransferase [Rhodospirillales bacterium]|nr:class I SAM-dependent methyltransferase [Rhodospirillales bacterium]MBT5430253.1 class I SAM-dependent methyltransferase [Rhodospirillaceae bacterium]